MSDETRAVLTTLCIIAILILWVPCLTLLIRHRKRDRNANSPATGQSKERLATIERRVESCTQTSDDESAGLERTAVS